MSVDCCLVSLCIYNLFPPPAQTGLPVNTPVLPLWVYSLSSWQRRTCRLGFMVSCGPAPPPQCSWFSSREGRQKRKRGEIKLNARVSKSASGSSSRPMQRHSVVWVEGHRTDNAALVGKAGYRPSSIDQCGSFSAARAAERRPPQDD